VRWWSSQLPDHGRAPYAREHQAAFARAVTDAATSAWICDVFVNAHRRGRWLGTYLAQCMVDDLAIDGPALLLAIKDAPGSAGTAASPPRRSLEKSICDLPSPLV